MKCGSFPSCSLDCINCPEHPNNDNSKDDMQEYYESNEADAYLSSLEFHDLKAIC